MLVGTDLDGSFWAEVDPPATLCISGRTWAEYDDTAKLVAQRMPLFIRGIGTSGDRKHAALFKARMIAMLGVTLYYEDDQFQAEIIRQAVSSVKVVIVVQNDRPQYVRRPMAPRPPVKKQRSVW